MAEYLVHLGGGLWTRTDRPEIYHKAQLMSEGDVRRQLGLIIARAMGATRLVRLLNAERALLVEGRLHIESLEIVRSSGA